MTTNDQNNHEARTHLNEIWNRLGHICRKLWEEDKSSAVPLQALVEEFKGETEQIEKTLQIQHKVLLEMRENLKLEYESHYQSRIQNLEQELGNLRTQHAAREEALGAARLRCEELSQKLEKAEAQSLQFRENILKAETEKETTRAQKMQAFYQDLNKKAEHLEKFWEERQRVLDAEHIKKAEDLRQKYQELFEGLKQRALDLESTFEQKEKEMLLAYEQRRQELQARETRCLQWENSLHQKEGLLNVRTQELENSYLQKRYEMEIIKNKLQKEITTLVKEYQAKISKGEATEGAL